MMSVIDYKMIENMRNPNNLRKLEKLYQEHQHLTFNDYQKEYLLKLIDIINDELEYRYITGVKSGMNIMKRYQEGSVIQKGDIDKGVRFICNIMSPNDSRAN